MDAGAVYRTLKRIERKLDALVLQLEEKARATRKREATQSHGGSKVGAINIRDPQIGGPRVPEGGPGWEAAEESFPREVGEG